MHLPRSWAILLLFAGSCALAGPPAVDALQARAPDLSIEGLGKGAVELDGPWQFHRGDDPQWAQPGIDDTAGQNGWEQIQLGDSGSVKAAGLSGYSWYRKRVHFTVAPGLSDEIALLIQGAGEASEVYWNGVLEGTTGRFPPHPEWDTVERAHIVHLGGVHEGVLALRVWKAPLDPASFPLSRSEFETAPALGALTMLNNIKAVRELDEERQRLFSNALGIVYGLIGCFCLVGWLRQRDQSALAWLSIFCLIRFLPVVIDPTRGSFAMSHVRDEIGSIQNVAEWFFLIYLYNFQRRPRLMQWAQVLSVVCVAAAFLDGCLVFIDQASVRSGSVYAWGDAILSSASILPGLFIAVLLILAARQRLGAARLFITLSFYLLFMVETWRSIVELGAHYLPAEWVVGLRPRAFVLHGSLIDPASIAETILAAALVFTYYRATMQSNRHQHRLEEELKSAREVQQVLIPEALPTLKGYQLTSAYRPAQEVGGDFFQIVPLDGALAGSAFVVVGDVSGKGLKAAMAVSMIVGMIRSLAGYVTSPSRMLEELNQRLCGRMHDAFATCIVARIDPDLIVLASAGHLPPLINGRELDLPGSLPLGISSEADYSEVRVFLNIGDQIAFFTDGLVEASNAARELYGFDRTQALFASRPSAAGALDEAIAFGQNDDITVLTLTPVPLGVQSTTTITVQTLRSKRA